MLRRSLLVLLVLVEFYRPIEGFRRRHIYPHGKQTALKPTDDPGDPLFLTPYLEQGKIDEARRLR